MTTIEKIIKLNQSFVCKSESSCCSKGNVRGSTSAERITNAPARQSTNPKLGA